MPENQHPFAIRRRDARWELYYKDSGTALFNWCRMTGWNRKRIWAALLNHRQDYGYDCLAVLWDLFPSKHRKKWELFLLNEAACGLKEAARGR